MISMLNTDTNFKSIDEYEDFLEIQDQSFTELIEKSSQEVKNGKVSSLDDLYKIHQDTLLNAKQKKCKLQHSVSPAARDLETVKG